MQARQRRPAGQVDKHCRRIGMAHDVAVVANSDELAILDGDAAGLGIRRVERGESTISKNDIGNWLLIHLSAP